jgi:hypothetical protein
MFFAVSFRFCDFSTQHACLSLCTEFASSGGNCPFYSIHLNFKHGGGGGGRLEIGRSLSVLHF